jgi:hypothetical protein
MGRLGQHTQDHPPAEAIALQHEIDAFELRAAGLRFREIGERIGLSEAGAHGAYKRAMERKKALLEHEVYEKRLGMVERNMAMRFAVYPRAIKGDIDSIKLVLALDKALSDLLGLAAPARTESSHQFEGAKAQVAHIVELMKQKGLAPEGVDGEDEVA